MRKQREAGTFSDVLTKFNYFYSRFQQITVYFLKKQTMALVVTNNFPMEYGAARMLLELNPDTVHVSINMQDIQHIGPIEEAIKQFVPKHKNPLIIFFGTYWQDYFDKFAAQVGKSAKICIFAPSKPSSSLLDLCTSNFVVDYDVTQEIGPLQWAFKTYSDHKDLLPKHPSAASWFETLNKPLFVIMDNRYYDKDSKTTQPWWTGFINTEPEITNEERWKRLYQGKYDQTKIIEKGSFILDSQRALCKERVEKNSRVIQYHLGSQNKVSMRVVSDHGSLITLTHDVVTDMGKEQVSAVIYTLLNKDKEDKRKVVKSESDMQGAAVVEETTESTKKRKIPSKEDEAEDTFAISFRAIDSSVDVREIARKYYGDGTPTRAGATISFRKLKEDF
jgi:hypothetical protein